MNYCVKKKLGLERVFDGKRLFILGIAVLLTGILVISLYDQIIIRYTIILAVLAVAFVKREKIKEILKSIQKKKEH